MKCCSRPEFEGRPIYENVNREIVALYLQERLVLDIGCGSGALGACIKGINPQCIVHGIDISGEACERAEKRIDRVWCLDLDQDPFPDSDTRYDLIILGDLLEHLKRPDLLFAQLHDHLNRNGQIILSVPNIANYSIRLRLLWGEFRYTETGILDRTHLRFFTLQSVNDLIRKSGFTVVALRCISRFPAQLCWFAPSLLAAQFIFRVKPSGPTPPRPSVASQIGSAQDV